MELTPIILLVSLLAFMLIGVPIAWALSLSCFAALLTMDSMPLALLTQRVFNGANNFSFLAVPAFVVAGEVMSHGNHCVGENERQPWYYLRSSQHNFCGPLRLRYGNNGSHWRPHVS